MAGVKRRMYTDSDTCALHKELDEVSCPICMDHPHNAVLLLCSSHEKGCRSYICDTSYRHSNCLDRFKKLAANSRNSPILPNPFPMNSYSSSTTDMSLALGTDLIEDNENLSLNEAALGTDLIEDNENLSLNEANAVRSIQQPQGAGENDIRDQNGHLETQGQGILETGNSESSWDMIGELDAENSSEPTLSLKCPMCRGAVLGLEVVEEARKYLNLKKRSCSRESCSFFGNYLELRRHARRVHPTTRPSEIDPSRERAWRHLEHQRDYGDIVSAIRSAMPGAFVVGDYVIENGDRMSVERESGTGEVNGPWWTPLLLFQMIGSIDNVGEARARSRAWTRQRRSAGTLSERRFLWGENLLGLQDDDDDGDDDVHVLSDTGEDASPIPRRRRRLMQSRSDEEQS